MQGFFILAVAPSSLSPISEPSREDQGHSVSHEMPKLGRGKRQNLDNSAGNATKDRATLGTLTANSKRTRSATASQGTGCDEANNLACRPVSPQLLICFPATVSPKPPNAAQSQLSCTQTPRRQPREHAVCATANLSPRLNLFLKR